MNDKGHPVLNQVTPFSVAQNQPHWAIPSQENVVRQGFDFEANMLRDQEKIYELMEHIGDQTQGIKFMEDNFDNEFK